MTQFNTQAFDKAFPKQIETLKGAEKITRETLRPLSRDVLLAVHATGHIRYMNELIEVLSPLNKRVLIEFFKKYTGYSFDKVQGLFTGKSKKRYDDARIECFKRLEDPNFNAFSWGTQVIERGAAGVSFDAFRKYMASHIIKLKNQGIDDVSILKAVIKGGLSPLAIVELMDSVGYDLTLPEAEQVEMVRSIEDVAGKVQGVTITDKAEPALV